MHLWGLSLALKDGEKSKDFKRKNRNGMETGSQRAYRVNIFSWFELMKNKS